MPPSSDFATPVGPVSTPDRSFTKQAELQELLQAGFFCWLAESFEERLSIAREHQSPEELRALHADFQHVRERADRYLSAPKVKRLPDRM